VNETDKREADERIRKLIPKTYRHRAIRIE